MNDQIIENSCLRVSIDGERGWFDVLEKETGTVWQHDPFENSPGELTLKRKSDSKIFTLDLGKASKITVKKTGPLEVELKFAGLKAEDGKRVPSVSVKTRIILDKEVPNLKVEVREVALGKEWEMVSLLYPARHFYLKTFADEGYLMISYRGQGSIVPSGRFKEVPQLSFPMWDDQSYTERACVILDCYEWRRGLLMPWFGAVKGQSAFIGVFETDNDAAVSCIFNYNLQHVFSQRSETSPYPRIASASPLWKSQKGELGYVRSFLYHFIPKGDYVDIAKHYRGIAKKNGLLKTLREKIKENPNVEKLLGSSMINMDGGYPWYLDYSAFSFTWQDVKEIITDLHDNLGVKKALFIVWGGYSKLPPESWPYNPKMGTVQELRETVKTAHEKGYLFCFYNAYPPLLEHASSWDPQLAKKDENGSLYRERWLRLCSDLYLKYAQENLLRAVKDSGQIADYSDCLTSPLAECYDPDHPTTRAKDRENQIEVLKYIRSLGLVNGTEGTGSWSVSYSDYAKNGLTSGIAREIVGAITVPLFNLVFHDCLVVYGAHGITAHSQITDYAESLLRDLAYGNHPNFAFMRSNYEGFREEIKQISSIFQDLTNAVALDELVDHEYLSDAYDVERTTFSSGVKVTINRGRRNFTIESQKIPPRGFLIEYPDGEIQTGQIKTQLEVRDKQKQRD